jgi:D-ribose pyranose/furanose isomerase RbsD
MLKTGILTPQINSLLARVRHTNMLVIADRGFPSWLTHIEFKKHVPQAIGLIRTGDTTQYDNMILVSGRVEPSVDVRR